VVHSTVLVGADGIRSRVARALGLARQGTPDRVALVTHLTGVDGTTDVGEMHVGPHGYVGLAPVGGGITNLAAVIDRRALPAGRSAAGRLSALLERFPAVRDRIAHAAPAGPVLATGPFARSTVRATSDRVVLVGDAADFYDPFTGEGIFAALRGAELATAHLLRAFEAGRFAAGTFVGYDRARRQAFAGKWWLERAIGAVIARPWVLDHVATRLARQPAVASLLVGATGDFVPARRVLRPSVAWKLVA